MTKKLSVILFILAILTIFIPIFISVNTIKWFIVFDAIGIVMAIFGLF